MAERERVVGVLRGFPWRRFGVCHVVLFGSLAREGRGRDVDLLVVPCRGVRLDPGVYLDLVSMLYWRLGVAVDVVQFGDAPCPVLRDAWKHGITVYTVDRGQLLWMLMKRLDVCLDEEVRAKMLGLVETALRSARRRWGLAPKEALRDGRRDGGEAGRARSGRS